MACPYFLPLRRLADATAIPGWKMPLGGVFAGQCRAPDVPVCEPPGQRLRECCNTGYPAGRCERFPANSPYDVVRLVIVAETEGGARLLYAYEKDHAPAGTGEIVVPAGAGVLEAQAHSYWNSYLERKWKIAP